jgi:tetratricopeptide (TPR) repeat protein
VPEDWNAHVERQEERYRDGSERLPEDPDTRQRQLTRMGNAAYGAGLAQLMLGDEDAAITRFQDAARTYLASYADAPPGSWGRLIAMMKASILAGDWAAAEEYARKTLDEGALESPTPIGAYAAALALLNLGRDEDARPAASSLRDRDDFPPAVADAVATLAAGDTAAYTIAVEEVLESFEQRDEYLEDIPVADTVLVLQALARRRGMAAPLAASAVLPSA